MNELNVKINNSFVVCTIPFLLDPSLLNVLYSLISWSENVIFMLLSYEIFQKIIGTYQQPKGKKMSSDYQPKVKLRLVVNHFR